MQVFFLNCRTVVGFSYGEKGGLCRMYVLRATYFGIAINFTLDKTFLNCGNCTYCHSIFRKAPFFSKQTKKTFKTPRKICISSSL